MLTEVEKKAIVEIIDKALEDHDYGSEEIPEVVIDTDNDVIKEVVSSYVTKRGFHDVRWKEEDLGYKKLRFYICIGDLYECDVINYPYSARKYLGLPETCVTMNYAGYLKFGC